MSEESLPEGWVNARFEEILIDPKADLVDGPFGSNLKSEEYVESGVPVLKIQNIKADRFVRRSFSYVTQAKSASLARHSYFPGDLMITKLGDPLGLCCEVPKDFPPGIFVADLMRLRIRTDEVSKRFVLLAINSQVVQAQFKEITKGTTRPRVNLTIVRSLEIPLPPLAEQKRIVAKIEELFSELDAGEASLRRARRQLGVYRQSLLKQAFEGKLTAKWREQHPDHLESPDQLLARIQAERQARYLQQLKEWEKAVKTWEKGGKKGKRPLKPRMSPDSLPVTHDELSDQPELPNSWKWVHPDALMSFAPYSIGIGPFGSNLKVSDYTDSGVPLVFVKNITRNDFGLEPRFVSKKKAEELAAHMTEGGDLLITKMGDPPGDCAIYPIGVPKAVITADCLKFRVLDEYCERGFYASFINSVSCRKQLGLITRGVAQKKISVDRFKSIGIPLCSLPEQQEIVRLLDAQFSAIEQTEREIDASLKRSEALRQSILKRAFTGQLVPQDPTDEPASALLERIREERSNDLAKPARKRAPTKTRP